LRDQELTPTRACSHHPAGERFKKMTDKITLADYDIKDFVFCDICACDGYTYEKVVFKYAGFRSEDEDGFAYKYTVNEFENPDRIHVHRSSRGTSYLQQQKTLDQPFLDNRLKEHFNNESCEIWKDFIGDHGFTDAITFIDMLPELFPRHFKNSISKSKEFVN
jgi:hypothetical protein